MATFDVSGVLYRDPETGCASTSGNQIAYEECRQSYYAKQQPQKITTTPAPATTDPQLQATDTTLNEKIDSLQREVHQLQLQQSTPPNTNYLEQYYSFGVICLITIIAGALIILTTRLIAKK